VKSKKLKGHGSAVSFPSGYKFDPKTSVMRFIEGLGIIVLTLGEEPLVFTNRGWAVLKAVSVPATSPSTPDA